MQEAQPAGHSEQDEIANIGKLLCGPAAFLPGFRVCRLLVFTTADGTFSMGRCDSDTAPFLPFHVDHFCCHPWLAATGYAHAGAWTVKPAQKVTGAGLRQSRGLPPASSYVRGDGEGREGDGKGRGEDGGKGEAISQR